MISPLEYLTNVLGLDELRAVEVLCHAPLENAIVTDRQRRWWFSTRGNNRQDWKDKGKKAVKSGGGVSASDLTKIDYGRVKFHVSDDAQQYAQRLFGRKLTNDEWAKLASSDGSGQVEVDYYKSSLGSEKLVLSSSGDHYESVRQIFQTSLGTILSNDNAKAHASGQGLGATVLMNQSQLAGDLGVSQIVTYAAGDGNHVSGAVGRYNGYYTWPRLGYDAELSHEDIAYLKEYSGLKLDSVRTLGDLMKTPEGRDAWRKHGFGIDAKFDPKPGSQSRRVLEEYIKDRAAKLTANAFASAASRRWYFANLGKKDGPKQGPVSANNFPADAAGNWEAVDKATGGVLDIKDATEIRTIIEEAAAAGESLDDLEFRPSTPETRAAEEKRREDAIAAHEARAAQIRAAELNPNLPGGKYWVEPPEKLYHATYAADEIAASGFKTAEQLGPSSDVLGGSRRDSVSFTTKANAEKYRIGLEVARRAAQGEINPDDFNALKQIGQQFGVPPSEMRKIADANSNIHDPKKRLFSILQGVSFAGRQFPLFMGGNWTDTVAKAKPAKLVEIDSKGPENWSYQPGETEWRIGDPQRIAGVRVVDSPTDNAFASEKQRKWYFANLAADKASGGGGRPPAKPTPAEYGEWLDKGWEYGPNGWTPPSENNKPPADPHISKSVHESARMQLSENDKRLVASAADWEKTKPWNITKEELETNPPPGFAIAKERGQEANYSDGTIHLSSKFFDLKSEEGRRHVVYHELGHMLADTMLRDGTSFQLHDAKVIPAKHDLGTGTSTGHGDEEALADSFALLHTDRAWLRKNHPALEKPVTDRARALGLPLPQDVTQNTLDPRDYLTAVLGMDETRAEQLLQNAFATATQRKWYFANLGKKGGPKAKGTVNKAAAAIKLADEQPLGGGVNTTFTAAAPPPINGLAVYKPASGEKSIHAAFPEGTLHQREIAASVLGDELGLANIPKTVLAEGSQGVGSAQAWSVGHLPISDQGRRLSSNMDWEEAEKMTVFDLVAGSSDRHPKNWLVRDDRTIVAIDNGFSFPDNAHLRAPQGQNQLRMRTSPSLMVRMPAQLSDATVARLESLKSRRAEVSAKLAPHLSEGEINSMWERLDVVLVNKDNFRNYFADDLKIAGMSFFNSKAFQ